MVALFISVVGHASTHLLLAQTHVTKRVYPTEPGYRGPMQSMHHTENGGTDLCVGIKCGGGGNLVYSS
jgi:hypothetical protein